MDIDALQSALRQRAQSAPRSKAAALRRLLPDIESALASGLNYESIVQLLSQQGLTMTVNTFSVTLSRIRKQTAQQGVAPVPAPLTATAATSSVATPDFSMEKSTPPLPAPAPVSGAPTSFEQFPDLPDRQRRELYAAQFVNDPTADPLLQRMLEQQKVKGKP